MATYTESSIALGTAEIHSFVVDFSADLLSGVTISSGTAYHIPPSGAAGTPTCSFGTAATSGTITIGTLSVIGVHYLDVLATLSDSEKSSIRIAFAVNYPTSTARAGMVDMIYNLRNMTAAGVNDYTLAGVPYWSDAQLQTALDRHRVDLRGVPLECTPTWSSGTPSYKIFYSHYQNLESGTAIEVQYTSGSAVGTAAYTVDAPRGVVTFTADTLGTAFVLYGNTYDLNATAADIWRTKAANVSAWYDFSTDNHNFSRSQVKANCLDMAVLYERQMDQSFTGSGNLIRSDT